MDLKLLKYFSSWQVSVFFWYNVAGPVCYQNPEILILRVISFYHFLCSQIFDKTKASIFQTLLVCFTQFYSVL